MMTKFKPRIFRRRSSKSSSNKVASAETEKPPRVDVDLIKWEIRPGGMLVQKRDSLVSDSPQKKGDGGEETSITIRISSTISGFQYSHDVSVKSSSTFGELKATLSLLTGLEPIEQRLLYRGKERGDDDHLHMVGVRDKDKILLLQHPAIKEMKLLNRSSRSMVINDPITQYYHHSNLHQHPYRTISV